MSSLPIRTESLHASLSDAPSQVRVVTSTGGASDASLGTPLHTLASHRAAARHVFGAGLTQKLQLEDALFGGATLHRLGSNDDVASDVLLGFDEMLSPSGAFFTSPGDAEKDSPNDDFRAKFEKKALRNF
jgi:hypothetical protein